jgi:hypothetical protein
MDRLLVHIRAQGEERELLEFFDLEVSFLPHPRYRAGDYASAVASLKERCVAAC